MPILHIQYTGQSAQPDGSSVDVPSSVAIMANGPRVQVTLTVPQSLAGQLTQAGQLVPAPLSGTALIDTGATSTCIDDGIARQLQLPVIDVTTISSASRDTDQRNVYPVDIEITGLSIKISAPRATGVVIASQGIVALIGRDVLQHCVFIYDGTTGQITLAV